MDTEEAKRIKAIVESFQRDKKRVSAGKQKYWLKKHEVDRQSKGLIPARAPR